MKKNITRRLLLHLPPIRIFDILIARVLFFVAHRRAPVKNNHLINDIFYRIKTDKSIESPLRQICSDKHLAKIFAKGLTGLDLSPKTLLKIDSYEEFSEENIPDKCVIKPTHLSGCIYFDRQSSPLSSHDLSMIRDWFRTNMYRDLSREKNYRYLSPCVICEEIIDSPDNIKDYKVFCYKGIPKFIQVDVGRHSKHKRRMYDSHWNPLEIIYNKPLADVEDRPSKLDEILEISGRISSIFEFMRVDFYITDDRVFLGELTSVPENAHGRFKSVDDERMLAKLLTENLPSQTPAEL